MEPFPRLNGLFGRPAGSVEGFKYSEANKNSGIVWSEEIFAEYIKNPRAKIPGAIMVFVGIKNEQEIKDLAPDRKILARSVISFST